MNLHEYEAKEIFARYRIPVPMGKVASDVTEVAKIASEIGKPTVLKAQVLAGGRGKAGGVKFANNVEDAKKVAAEMFSKEIKGLKIEKLLVEEKLDIQKELYTGITIDRSAGKPIVMVSSEGGIEIEEVAKKMPSKIFKMHINPFVGFYPYMARELIEKLRLEKDEFKAVSGILWALYKVFKDHDAQIAEINPLATTKQGIFAADAKLIIDDDALFRQKFGQEKKELPYVELNGYIGCIVNGAGLAMSTMDTLKHLGGEPANFLDIGGGASAEVMKKALEKVSAHSKVKVILINILGGITRCDDIAKGILSAIGGISVPVVVRFRGTNEEEGVKILRDRGFDMQRDMVEAAKKAIEVGR
jgi:succinyl-CoA synthetase beta subunit